MLAKLFDKQKLPINTCYLILLPELIFILYFTFIQSMQNDENEHIYNAYMVYLGNRPYLDFFEHHNPLLWYITSPLFYFFENNIAIYYIFRFIMLICIFMICIYTYKIAKIAKLNTFFSLISVCIFLSFDILKQTGIQIRPDTPMALFCLMGIYYFIKYLENKKIKLLSLSFIYFTISFWLLQKAVALILPILIYLFAQILTKKIKIIDILSASFIPIILTFIYILYLYKTNALNLYYVYNYSGNFENTRSYGFFKNNSYNFTYGNKTILLCLILTFISLLKSVIKNNKYFALISCYTIICFFSITHILYAADRHYMIPILPLFAILVAYLLQKNELNKLLKITSVLIFLIFQISFNNKLIKNVYPTFNNFIEINKFITENTNKNDEVFIYVKFTGIKKQIEGYYYFGQQDIVLTSHDLIPYKDLPNYVELIQNKKPKLILPDFNPPENLIKFIVENYTPITLNKSQITFYKRNY